MTNAKLILAILFVCLAIVVSGWLDTVRIIDAVKDNPIRVERNVYFDITEDFYEFIRRLKNGG